MSMDVAVKNIDVTGWNPRKSFNEEELVKLLNNVREYGIKQALTVRPSPNDGGRYQLISGHRRLEVAKRLDMTTVPVMVTNDSDQVVRQIMLIENLLREDLNPMEEAEHIRNILDIDGISQRELAKKLDRTQGWISQRLKLLEAPVELREKVITRVITAMQVREILPYVQYPIYKVILHQFEKELTAGNEVSVRYLKENIIHRQVTKHVGEMTLNLDDFSIDNRKLKPYFDFSNCDQCLAVRQVKNEYNQAHRYCIDRRCWKNRLNEGKQKYDKEKEDLLKHLKDRTVIDISMLDWNLYQHLHPGFNPWIKTVCRGCENKKKTLNGDTICIDVKCYKRHERSQMHGTDKKHRQERIDTWDAVDRFLDSEDVGNFLSYPDGSGKRFEVPLDIMKRLVEAVAKHGHHEQLKHGIRRWPEAYVKETSKHGHNSYSVNVEKIPEEDLLKALIRFMAAEEIDYCKNYTKKDLLKFLPDAVPFYEKGGK